MLTPIWRRLMTLLLVLLQCVKALTQPWSSLVKETAYFTHTMLQVNASSES